LEIASTNLLGALEPMIISAMVTSITSCNFVEVLQGHKVENLLGGTTTRVNNNN